MTYLDGASFHKLEYCSLKKTCSLDFKTACFGRHTVTYSGLEIILVECLVGCSFYIVGISYQLRGEKLLLVLMATSRLTFMCLID